MGCFFACFGAGKHRNRRHLVDVKYPSKDQGDEISEALKLIESTKQKDCGPPITLLKDRLEEPLECSSPKKEVTFDLNVKTREATPAKKSAEHLVKKDNDDKKSYEKEEEKTAEVIKSFSNTAAPKLVSYLPNHRYQNCTDSYDEHEDLDVDESDVFDDVHDGGNLGNDKNQEESSESLFSLSVDSRRKQEVSKVALGEEKEVSSPVPICGSKKQELAKFGFIQDCARDKNEYVHSVLKPVENLTQWKAAKTRRTVPLGSQSQEKENLNLVEVADAIPICVSGSVEVADAIPICVSGSEMKLMNENPKQDLSNGKIVSQVITVDTSLSSWLVGSDSTPESKSISSVSVGNLAFQNENSGKSREDRVVLGELSMEKVKELSNFTSPMGSCSSDEPAVGTIGSYWRQRRKVLYLDSCSSSIGLARPRTKHVNEEDEGQKCHSTTTPFEARLTESFGCKY